MNNFLPFFSQDTVIMSASELVELREELYAIQAAAGPDWAIQNKVLRMLSRIDAYLDQTNDELEREEDTLDAHPSHLLELPMLMQQAQLQCQQ